MIKSRQISDIIEVKVVFYNTEGVSTPLDQLENSESLMAALVVHQNDYVSSYSDFNYISKWKVVCRNRVAKSDYLNTPSQLASTTST